MKKLLLACALFATSFLSALAADNPWIGTWKLDLAKSQFTGETFSYSKSANGLMHYSDGSTISFDFGIDGKEYKSAFNRTTTWSAAGDNAWDSVTKADGNVLANFHRVLSADGKTLTITATGTRPDGTAFNDVTVYKRVTGTKGLVGKWRSTKVEISAPGTVVMSIPSSGVWRLEFPGYKNTVEGKADGTDLPVIGPTAPPGWTVGIKFGVSHQALLCRKGRRQAPRLWSLDPRHRWQVIHRRVLGCGEVVGENNRRL